MRWVLVVPVKRLAVAKTRLAGLDPHARADLALAFAEDTVSVARSAELVADVVVVTDDPTAADRLRGSGANVVADEPDAGLVPALLHGAQHAAGSHPGCGVGALSGDLPALRAAELDAALAAAEQACAISTAGAAMVADPSGTGTTLLVAARAADFAPQFGPRSRARHRAAGVIELGMPGIPSVRRDVDTEVDLADATRLGVGPHTAAVLARLNRFSS